MLRALLVWIQARVCRISQGSLPSSSCKRRSVPRCLSSATCSFTSNRPERRDQNLERHGVLALVLATRFGIDV
jgi:hypothetical protein